MQVIDLGAQVLSNQIDRSRNHHRLLYEITACERELNLLTRQFMDMEGISADQWDWIDSMLRRISIILFEARRDLRRLMAPATMRRTRSTRFDPYTF